MPTIEQEIEQMAETLEKSTTSEKDFIKKTILELGKDGIRKAIPALNDHELALLKECLEELRKAQMPDSELAPKKVETKNSDLKTEEQTGSDDEDEDLMIEEMAEHPHQGDTSPEGFEGQVIKSEAEKEDLEKGGPGSGRKGHVSMKNPGDSMKRENARAMLQYQNQKAAEMMHDGKISKEEHNSILAENKKAYSEKMKKSEEASNEEETLEKASKGAGSRGGKVIGHTRSGKPIYAPRGAAAMKTAREKGDNHEKDDSKHSDYSLQDHMDAMTHHMVRRRDAGVDNWKEKNKHDVAERYHDRKIGEMTGGYKFTDEHKKMAKESMKHAEGKLIEENAEKAASKKLEELKAKRGEAAEKRKGTFDAKMKSKGTDKEMEAEHAHADAVAAHEKTDREVKAHESKMKKSEGETEMNESMKKSLAELVTEAKAAGKTKEEIKKALEDNQYDLEKAKAVLTKPAEEAATPAPEEVKKSVVWTPKSSIAANTLGRNCHYETNDLIEKASKEVEEVKKSGAYLGEEKAEKLEKSEQEGEKKADINDLIEKGMDYSAYDIDRIRQNSNSKGKGVLIQKSYSEEDLLNVLGIDKETAEKVAG